MSTISLPTNTYDIRLLKLILLGIQSLLSFEANTGVWEALLGICRIHCNVELAKHAVNHLLKLEPHLSGPYVQLFNIYATASRWDENAKIRKMLKSEGVKNET
jgi:hypothetical protein